MAEERGTKRYLFNLENPDDAKLENPDGERQAKKIRMNGVNDTAGRLRDMARLRPVSEEEAGRIGNPDGMEEHQQKG